MTPAEARKRKARIIYARLLVLFALIAYTVPAFVTLELNPVEWPMVARGAAIVLWAAFTVATAGAEATERARRLGGAL